MPVPTSIDQLSTTAATNFPSGSDSPSSLDDTQRAYGAFIATVRDVVGLGTGTLVPATARANFGAAASGANTDITSLNAPALGAATATTATAGDSSTKVATTEFVMGNSPKQIQPITASVAANALTITLNPTTLDFRSSSLTSGTVNTRQVSAAISVVISSGSTLGTVSAQQSRIAVLAIDNAGTVELAAVNIAGGNELSETGLISTTAEGGAGAADSASTIYSTTARTNVPYRVVGYVESTQTTAGTWATAPSTIQGYGGQAFAAMSSLGYGQTWQAFTVTAQRNFGVTYYNTTGKPIEVTVTCNNSSQSNYTAVVNGQTMWISTHLASTSIQLAARCLVPPGQSYQITSSAGTPLSPVWTELR